MQENLEVDHEEFQARKKARIKELRKPQSRSSILDMEMLTVFVALPPPGPPMVSAPTNHEVAGYMPGRLEFEHEVDNEAEMAVKDMEFRLVYKYGGDEQPQAKIVHPSEDDDEEESDRDEKGSSKNLKAKEKGTSEVNVKEEPREDSQPRASSSRLAGSASPTKPDIKGKGKGRADPQDEMEDEDELEIKLAMLDIYFSKLDKREEAKDLIFDRGLTDHKRVSWSVTIHDLCRR